MWNYFQRSYFNILREIICEQRGWVTTYSRASAPNLWGRLVFDYLEYIGVKLFVLTFFMQKRKASLRASFSLAWWTWQRQPLMSSNVATRTSKISRPSTSSFTSRKLMMTWQCQIHFSVTSPALDKRFLCSNVSCFIYYDFLSLVLKSSAVYE